MTEEQMEKLAEIIFQKLLTRQSEFDKQFIEQLKESKGDFEVEVRSPYESILLAYLKKKS